MADEDGSEEPNVFVKLPDPSTGAFATQTFRAQLKKWDLTDQLASVPLSVHQAVPSHVPEAPSLGTCSTPTQGERTCDA
jgi:hypothetical protein